MKNLYVFMLLILFICINTKLWGKELWRVIPTDKSSVKFVEGNELISFDKNYYKEFKDEDFEGENMSFLGLREIMSLISFTKKNIPYKYRIPEIIGEIENGYFKSYKFIKLIEYSRQGTEHVSNLLFGIGKDGKHIERFRKFEWESQDRHCGIIIDDIKGYNTIIKNEKINIKSSSSALDIVKIFLIISRGEANKILWNAHSVKKVIKKKCKTNTDQLLEKLKNCLHEPKFTKRKGKYIISFITFISIDSDDLLYFDSWKFKVSRNGSIKVIFHELFEIDLKKGVVNLL